MTRPRQTPGGILALIGGLYGLLCALALAVLRGVLGAGSGEPLPFGLPGDVVFGAVYALPFALTLIALGWGDPVQRAAAWAAGALLAIMAAFTAFSGVSLVFLPAAPILLLAALRAMRGFALRPIALSFGLAALLIALNAGAFRVLFLQDDGACWQVVRSADGQESWQAAPYSNSGMMSASAGGAQETRCSSDTFSTRELVFSAGLLALAVGVWLWAGRAARAT